MPLDHQEASRTLNQVFDHAEQTALEHREPVRVSSMSVELDILFETRTQSFREALLGVALAKMIDPSINVRLPYADQGEGAFSGRSLDEKVVNPVLQARRIPCSKGPYLAVFRRSVKFDSSVRDGVKDKEVCDAFLRVITWLETAGPQDVARLLSDLAFRFVLLRERTQIAVVRVPRMSLEQCNELARRLLAKPSGGRFPVVLVLAGLKSLKEVLNLDWEIDYQGINVADSASGALGDITVRSQQRVVLVGEVTLRPVTKQRFLATLNDKVIPRAIRDYLFFCGSSGIEPEVEDLARQYFSHGYEVVFVDIHEWLREVLATLGSEGRAKFCSLLADIIGGDDLPAACRMAWNDAVRATLASQ